MHTVDRSEWIEWLDGLELEGIIEVDPRPDALATASYCFAGADYAPFDDIIEVRLRSDTRCHRILVDSPTRIWADRPDPHPDWVMIDAGTHRLVIVRHRPVLEFRVEFSPPSRLPVDRPHLLHR